ncbi:MAG: ATP-binding cassette domain-containing protein [Candidatus Marinimicrobia bacterium]|jgi:ABC-type multidrug transport system ATPase subunit|nr:ATP-binding cassette domain-containing protein [Candidatus Neomarinimicrobiota bacterium]MBT3675919.1 ATP-binding cassette domain-containing protein [Candidatus Neomarinimicrobiota bacterium]MBT3763204.1 ATP-binding cassette domain-containing protein [Candidatus Neomarinimicrobiota bacterium]MBT4069047.1 ATP-binding cassette domain-containing protein [Candidatus Neomarinimicrobiota bacterium]MBT4269946.1 ATP-binding cassette domain-containing protein [Candidatus Neomarinimicrobiota bacterium
MNDRGTSIYDIQGIKKSYGNHTILNIRRLEFHRGTIYGIIGPIGSGKSTLFNILAGLKKPNEGVVKYDDAEFETNWMGKLKTIPEIALANIDSIPKGSKVSDVIKSMDKNRLEKRAAKYFNNGSLPFLLNRKVSDLSPGELAWINMIIAVESDPRVLMIDDYGVFFDTNMESDFRKKLIRMNKDLGTTIIVAAPSDQNIKRIASVLIYLDNGHISKIRPGAGRGNFRQERERQPSRRRQRNNR